MGPCWPDFTSTHFRRPEALCFQVVHPSAHWPIHMNLVNSRMHEENSFNLGGSTICDMTMNWLDFGFHRSKVKVTTWSNVGKILALKPDLHSDVPSSNLCQLETLIRAVLSVFENLRSKFTRRLNMSKKFSFGAITPFIYTRWEFLWIKKTDWGSVKHFWNMRSKGQGHHMTK